MLPRAKCGSHARGSWRDIQSPQPQHFKMLPTHAPSRSCPSTPWPCSAEAGQCPLGGLGHRGQKEGDRIRDGSDLSHSLSGSCSRKTLFSPQAGFCSCVELSSPHSSAQSYILLATQRSRGLDPILGGAPQQLYPGGFLPRNIQSAKLCKQNTSQPNWRPSGHFRDKDQCDFHHLISSQSPYDEMNYSGYVPNAVSLPSGDQAGHTWIFTTI